MYTVFTDTYTILSSMYRLPGIRDGGHRVFGMDSLHTGSYSRWFPVGLCLLYQIVLHCGERFVYFCLLLWVLIELISDALHCEM